jgi:Transposase DDE domain/Domain of unknown function (DUF4372)
MSKGSFFTGQPIFNQILNFVPDRLVASAAAEFNSDYYFKRFKTRDHLITMIYAIFNHCTSLREVTTGLLAAEHRIGHLGLKYFPRRSTISDANQNRNPEVFGKIYHKLLEHHQSILPDSRLKKNKKEIYIVDSTTITLFKEILKAAGPSHNNGKRKGGIKVHTVLHSGYDVPVMIRYSASASPDSPFLREINIPKGATVIFDRGYNDYKTYNRFDEEGVTWVTRLREDSVYEVTEKRTLTDLQKQKGLRKDEFITLGHNHHSKAVKVRARKIDYKDPVTKKRLVFITNNRNLSALTIAAYYQKRWQVETFFKRIKQNYPVQYFLGDNDNAIQIQIWCALIADLLLKIIKNGTRTKMSYSNMNSLIRLHMMTYMNLTAFLRAPEKSLLIRINEQKKQDQVRTLFDP